VWQRDALQRIVSKGRLDEDGLNNLCKQSRSAKNTGPKAIPLEKARLPANPDLSPRMQTSDLSPKPGEGTGQILGRK
jgi:hypothetical protein